MVTEVPLGGSAGLIGVAGGSSWFFSDTSKGVVLAEVSNDTNDVVGAWELNRTTSWVIHDDRLFVLDLETRELSRYDLDDF